MALTPSMPALGTRGRLVTLWFFLTLATVGFCLVLAGFTLDSTRWLGLGAAAVAFGALAFVYIQFWAVGTATLAAPATPRPPRSHGTTGIDFSYDAKPSTAPRMDAAETTNGHRAPGAEAPLVEFELVSEPKAPTKLVVPNAFQLEQTLDAAPPEPRARPWPARGMQREDFVPATERRSQIVSGLPLLSSILAEEPPEAVQVQAAPPAGRMRGQCSSCHTYLWAPTQRPIRLRCPRCGHVRTLND